MSVFKGLFEYLQKQKIKLLLFKATTLRKVIEGKSSFASLPYLLTWNRCETVGFLSIQQRASAHFLYLIRNILNNFLFALQAM